MTEFPGSRESTPERAAAGARSTLRSHALRFLCKVAGVVVMARLVPPADHGTFAMAASVLVLVALLRDGGTGTASVQAAELGPGQLVAVWRLQLALGVMLTLATLALIPTARSFFREPAVGGILAGASLSFLLIGAGTTPRNLLLRALRFDVINRIETTAAMLGTAAMVAAGAAGAGPYAFVVFLLVSEGSVALLAWRACGWVPRGPPDWAGLRTLLRPGAHLTLHGLLLAAAQQAETFFIGRWFGPHVLGLYNRAGQLLAQPATHLSGPLANLLLANLARLRAADPGFARELRTSANLIAHLTLPVATACAAMPAEIIQLVLGTGWQAATPLLPWLALGAAAGFMGATAFPACIAAGHTRRLVPIGIAGLAVTLAALLLGRPHGPEGIAAAAALAQVVMLAPRLAWSVRGTAAGLTDLVRALTGPLQVSAVFGAGLLGGRALASGAGSTVRLAASITAGLAAASLLVLCFRPLRAELRALLPRLPFPR